MNKKQIISLVLALLILIGALTPVIVNASETESTVKDAASEYFKDESDEELNNSVYGGMEKFFSKNGGKELKPADNFEYLFYRLIGPKTYITHIDNSPMPDKEYADSLYKDRDYICGLEPNNLLNHNCDVPNMITELAQNIVGTFYDTGIVGGEITSAKTDHNFGLPANIPGGEVPINPSGSAYTYTPLERFGYDLKYTKYLGEWDHIIVRSDGRSLSSFGFWGKVKLFGGAFFKGITTGVSTFFKEATLNPLTWLPALGKAFEAGTAATLLEIINAFDANIIYTHKWARPKFAKTVYNAYYLTDQQVQMRAEEDFNTYYKVLMEQYLGESPRYLELIEANPANGGVPNFRYRPKKQTKESIAATNAWSKKYMANHNAAAPIYERLVQECLDAKRATSGDPRAMSECHTKAVKSREYQNKLWQGLGPKPKPVYMTKQEQFDEFLETDAVKSYRSKMSKLNISVPTSGNPDTWVKQITDSYNDVYAKEGKNGGEIFEKVTAKSKEQFFKDFYNRDVDKEISHWVCYLGPNKEPTSEEMLDESVTPLLYTAHNGRDKQNISKPCSGVVTRSPVKGGLFSKTSNDSRWAQFQYSQENNTPIDVDNGGFFNSLTVTITKLTNSLISLSYENIIERLNLMPVFGALMKTVTDSLFLPLITLGLAISAVWIFYKVAHQRSLILGFKAFLTLALIAVLGSALLDNPEETLRKIDDIGNKADLFVAELVLANDPNEICYSSGESSGVRSAQCQVWYNNIYLPWSFGQWGVPPSRLENSNFDNTNSGLVGKGTVHFGDGVSKNDWGLYQLSKMKSGSITTVDKKATKAASKDLYKVVDLQFGPSGNGHDGKYALNWANGKAPNGFLTMILAITVLIGIGGIAFAKIEATVSMIFYTAMLPFVLLRGLFPGGEGKVRQWATTMLGLFLKRISIVVFLAVILRVLYAVGNANLGGFAITMISLSVIMIAMTWQWKAFSEAVVGGMDQHASNMMGAVGGALPPALNYRLNQVSNTVIGTATGYAGGLLAGLSVAANPNYEGEQGQNKKLLSVGTLKTIRKYAREGGRMGGARLQSIARREQRRKGFGLIDTYDQVTQSIKQDASDSLVKLDHGGQSQILKNGQEDDGIELLAANHEEMAALLGVKYDPELGLGEFDVKRKLSAIFKNDLGLQNKIRKYSKNIKNGKYKSPAEEQRAAEAIFQRIGAGAHKLKLFEENSALYSNPYAIEEKEFHLLEGKKSIFVTGQWATKQNKEEEELNFAMSNIVQYNSLLKLQSNYKEYIKNTVKDSSEDLSEISAGEKELYDQLFYNKFSSDLEKLVKEEKDIYRDKLIAEDDELQKFLEKRDNVKIGLIKTNLEKKIKERTKEIEKQVKVKEDSILKERENYKNAYYASIHNSIFSKEEGEIEVDSKYSKIKASPVEDLVDISDLSFEYAKTPDDLEQGKTIDLKGYKEAEIEFALDEKYRRYHEDAAQGKEYAIKILKNRREEALEMIDNFEGFQPGTTKVAKEKYLKDISRKMGWLYEEEVDEYTDRLKEEYDSIKDKSFKEIKELEKEGKYTRNSNNYVDSINDLNKEHKKDRIKHEDTVSKRLLKNKDKFNEEEVIDRILELQIKDSSENADEITKKRSARELLLEKAEMKRMEKAEEAVSYKEKIEEKNKPKKDIATAIDKVKEWADRKTTYRENMFNQKLNEKRMRGRRRTYTEEEEIAGRFKESPVIKPEEREEDSDEE